MKVFQSVIRTNEPHNHFTSKLSPSIFKKYFQNIGIQKENKYNYSVCNKIKIVHYVRSSRGHLFNAHQSKLVLAIPLIKL